MSRNDLSATQRAWVTTFSDKVVEFYGPDARDSAVARAIDLVRCHGTDDDAVASAVLYMEGLAMVALR